MSEVETVQIDIDGVTFERQEHEKFQQFIRQHNDGGPAETPVTEPPGLPPR